MSTLASSRGVSIMALAVEAAAPAINTRLQKKESILQMKGCLEKSPNKNV